MRRWTNGLPGATARLGAIMTPFEVYPLVSVGCARIPILARSINAPHQRSDTLMQLSRSPAQRSALRRTAGPYMLAHLLLRRHCSISDGFMGQSGRAPIDGQ